MIERDLGSKRRVSLLRFTGPMTADADHIERLDFSSDPPPGWRHPVTGRRDWKPSPEILLFGRYVRRARYFARLSQDDLAWEAQVSQSMVSRLERGDAPAMGIDRLIRVGAGLGNNLPLGFCPHTHLCPWQPIVGMPPPPDPDAPPEHGLSPEMHALTYTLGETQKR